MTPFGDPNRLKISPRPVLRRLCFKNIVFQNMSPALGESTILILLGSQDGTKIGPRSPQDRLKIVLKCDRFLRRFLIDFWSSWAPFWLPFGTQVGAKNRHLAGRKFGLCWVEYPLVRQSPPRAPQDAPRPPKSAPRPPKTTKTSPKMTKNDPKRPPRRPKITLNDPQDDTKCRQDKIR